MAQHTQQRGAQHARQRRLAMQPNLRHHGGDTQQHHRMQREDRQQNGQPRLTESRRDQRNAEHDGIAEAGIQRKQARRTYPLAQPCATQPQCNAIDQHGGDEKREGRRPAALMPRSTAIE